MTQRSGQDQEKKSVQVDGDDLLRLRTARDAAVQAAREAVRDTTRLTRLLTILNDPGPLNLLLDRILSTLSELFLADIVVLLDPAGTGSFSPLAAIGLSEDLQELPFSDEEGSYIECLMRTGVPMIMEHAGADRKLDFQLREMGAQTVVGLPVDGTHAARGVLIMARCNPHPFTDAEVGLLRTMAYRIGRALTEAQRSIQFEKIVLSGREISRHLELSALVAEAARMFPVIVSADASAIVLSDPTGELYCAAQTGLSSPCATAISQLARHLITFTAVGKGAPYSTADMTTTLAQLSLESLKLLPVRALLAIPIHRKDLVHGVLFAVRFSAIAYNSGTAQIAMLYAEQVSAAIENAGLYQAVHSELAERKRLEAEQRKWERQQQQLQKANSLNSMAGAIAHHFNNQLSVVMGNLEIALADLPRGTAIVKTLTDAMQGACKAVEVSSSMLTYLGQTTGVRVPLDLSQACRQSLPLLEAAAPEGIVIKTHLASPAPIIIANANQIQQVLTNLVTNAWEAVDAHQGGIDLTIQWVAPADIAAVNRFPIDWQPQDLVYTRVDVTDTGCGIAEEDIERLFDPFFSSKFIGRGLGLPVVLGIVRAHGGVITVESKQGQGSTFRVFLPVSAEVSPPKTDKTANPLATEGKTVLLVDDEKMVREMATTMLTRLGCKVLIATDGIEALEVFQNHPDEIDIVLCDLSMPRMNGWETLTALRRIRPDLPVVLTSGHDESNVITGDHPEITHQVFLHKPYRKAALKESLARAVYPAEGGDRQALDGSRRPGLTENS